MKVCHCFAEAVPAATSAGLTRALLLRSSATRATVDQGHPAFLASYTGDRGGNRFTKVRIDLAADEALRRYFQVHESDVETWYNVIAPKGRNLGQLRSDLRSLADKDWKGILNG